MNQSLMVYLRNNLPKKDGVYTINLDEYKAIGIHWIALYVIDDNVTYFDIFRAEYFAKKKKKKYRQQNQYHYHQYQ